MKTLLLPLAALAIAAPALADVTTTPITGTELDVQATGTSTRTPDIATSKVLANKVRLMSIS